jgi:thiamine kinase-like enzyme
MFVLSLCRHLCPDKIPYPPDIRLGEGADGEVFSIINDNTKVIKLGIKYEYGDEDLDKEYRRISQGLEYFINVQPRVYARVYEQGYLGTFSREISSFRGGKQKFIIYYYTMEKLEKITEDEKKVFHSILSHEDRGIEKKFSPDKVREMLQGMGRGLDFDVEKVTFFYENIKSASVSHLDIHARNIMKNGSGDFKLIDLDRIKLENNND